MLASTHDVTLQKDDAEELSKAMQSLPPFAEVPAALQRLGQQGFRLVVLTNSSTSALHNQLRNAGLADLFEEGIPVDELKKYKPAPDVYQYAADELDLRTLELLMIAVHPWDLIGAHKAGCKTAFLLRPGAAWISITEPPDFCSVDLNELASVLGSKFC